MWALVRRKRKSGPGGGIMPELPDLVHIVRILEPGILGRRIVKACVKEPIVLRLQLPGSLASLVEGRRFASLERHGPFLHFGLDCAAGRDGESGLGAVAIDLVMHLMLAGRLRLAARQAKALPATAFSLELDDGNALFYGDDKRMGKVYVCERGRFEHIPGYLEQGIDICSTAFDFEAFSALIAGKRMQARVFLMDQGKLSAIGNAYADEILFEAKIHPKTSCSALKDDERRRLYEAIGQVIRWGVDEVEKAGRPLEEKVRGHMRVRNRAGTACPRCGSTIRKAGVLGFDAFFCPRCQPERGSLGRSLGLDWSKLPPKAPLDPGDPSI
jgi:formamidopyrimidine-DNA glycosylase